MGWDLNVEGAIAMLPPQINLKHNRSSHLFWAKTEKFPVKVQSNSMFKIFS